MERILFVALLALLVYLVYLVFLPFLVPLAWGVVFAIMFYPLHQRVHKRIARANLAALVTTLLLTAVLIVPTLLVAGAFTAQAVQLAGRVQADWEQGRMPLSQVWQGVPVRHLLDWLARHNIEEQQLRDFVTQNMDNVASFVAGQLGALARNLAFFVFNLFVALFASFYLFRDGPVLLGLLRRVLPLDDEHREALFTVAHDVLYASVFSGLVVAAVQGTLGGVVFWLIGIKAAVLWGVVMAFFALLPVVGPWIIWLPAVLSFLLSGQYVRAVILLALGGLVISMVDNILRPILLSGRSQLNGLLVFISILGGVAAFGVLGIVLGPILVALADAVLETYTAEDVPAAPASASK